MRKLIAYYLFVMIAVISSAQSSSFETFDLDDGLFNAQIQTINQDARGNLWIGSIGGLAKYNGVEFENFHQKDGMAEEWVTATYIRNNGLWVGHWGGGITYVNLLTNQISKISYDEHKNFNRVTSIVELEEGVLRFGTEGNGYFDYNIEQHKFERKSNVLSEANIYKLYKDSLEQVWTLSDQGVFVSYKGDYDVLNPLSLGDDNVYSDILEIEKGKLWVSHQDSGMVNLTLSFAANGKIDSFKTKKEPIDSFRTKRVRSFLYDRENVIWISTERNGVYQYYRKNKVSNTKDLVFRFSNKDEARYFKVNQFFLDRENNVWLGSELGLHKYLGELFKTYNRSDGLINNLVWEVFVDKRDHVWVGTSGGVSKLMFPYLKRKKQFSNPKVVNYTVEQGLRDNIIVSICQDEDGLIWMASETRGLCILNEETQKFEYIDIQDGLLDNHIFDIKLDKSNNIWVGTKKGVSVINARTREITNYTEKDGLGGKKVYSIYVDYKGAVWLSILGGNLTRYRSEFGFDLFGIQQGVQQKYIVGASGDKDQNIWFATYGEGIVRYDLEKFKHYPINGRNGFTGNSPHFVIGDMNNNVWIGLNLGLQKYDKTLDQFVEYGVSSGYGVFETTENSAAVDDYGNVWFGTLKGLVKLNPRKDIRNKIEPITEFESLEIAMEETEFPDEPIFYHGDNHLTFNVLGVSLTNPQEVYYSYKLEGLSQSWSPATKESKVTYTNLAPGKYTLYVKARNNSDVWNDAPKQYSFEIKPPIWKTKAFYAAIIVALVLGIIFTIRYRESNLKGQKEKLENEVSKRTQELMEKNVSIEKQSHTIQEKNRQITDSINYAKSIQHAILPPDHKIRSMIPEFFLYYRPRDIVSGDFFWIKKIDGKVVVAAVDCTGHGVPGAFMSIVGCNALEKIVGEQRITKPSEILNKLSKEITNTLRQEELDGVKDGMDISLCSLDFMNKKMEFAGAYNPAYIIRNKELIQIDGDRLPIGTPTVKIEGKYQNHELDLQSNDMIYLFSDGYVDQLGGSKRKKFKYKRFKNMLITVSDMPAKVQYIKIDQAMKEWKADVMQYDDMLIWGIRV